MAEKMYDIEVERISYERIPYRGLYYTDAVRVVYYPPGREPRALIDSLGEQMARRIVAGNTPDEKDAQWYQSRVERVVINGDWIFVTIHEPYID